MPFASQGLCQLPVPFALVELGGQSCGVSGAALALAEGVTAATLAVGAADADGAAEAVVAAASGAAASSLQPTHATKTNSAHVFVIDMATDSMLRPVRKVIVILALLAGCGASPPPFRWTTTLQEANPLVGKAWDARTHALVSPERADAAAVEATFVLLGEKHDNPDHHRLQARSLKALVDHGRKPAVVFEQIDLDLQSAVDAFLASGSSNVDELGKVLEWDKRGWPAWSMYRPIFEVVLAAKLKIVAAGLTKEMARKVVHEGPASLPPDVASRVRLVPLEPHVAASLDEEIKASHCGMLPDALVAPMSLAQRVKDALMADLMKTSATQGGAVLIAGNGHVRTDRGVPIYLSGRAVTISFVEVDGTREPASYETEDPATFLVFTPRVDEEDPCAKFHAHSEPAETSSTSKISVAFGGTAGGTPRFP